MSRGSRRVLLRAAVALLLTAGLLAPGGHADYLVGAVLTDSATVGSGSLTTDVIDPPANLAGQDIGAGVEITLTWTATPDTYAAGYRIFRSTNGGAFVEVATVSPRTTTTYLDNTGLSLVNQYRYYLISYIENWVSVQSNTVTCTAVVVLLLCS